MEKTEVRKLILCRGIQGSGKSTWAKQWAEEDPDNRVRFNNDDIRNMLGKYWVPSREGIVKTMKDTFAKVSMLAGKNIVIDNMNLNPKEVEYWRDLIEYNNDYYTGARGEFPSTYKANYFYELEFKNFFISVDECIRRDAMRSNPIGEKVIKDTWRRYRSFILQEKIKELMERKRAFDIGKPSAIVVDMDATLCLNTSGRPFYGEGAAEGMAKDTPIPEIVELVKLYSDHSDTNVIILSGREDTPEIREATETWLHKYGIYPTGVLLRSIGDYSKGEVCKKELMEHVLKSYNVKFVIDDNNRCVQMYRDMGLTVLQPNEGSL